MNKVNRLKLINESLKNIILNEQAAAAAAAAGAAGRAVANSSLARQILISLGFQVASDVGQALLSKKQTPFKTSAPAGTFATSVSATDGIKPTPNTRRRTFATFRGSPLQGD